jgi:YidC/Oxa1 family membrane protein insertase
MDRTGIIVVSICVLLLVYWFREEQKQEESIRQRQQMALTNRVAALPAVNPQPGPSVAMPPALFDTNVAEQTIVLTNERVRYTFTSRGGGLKRIELLDHTNRVTSWSKSVPVETNPPASLNAPAPVPVLAVMGDTNMVGDGNFSLTKTDYGVRAEKALPIGVRVTKEFYFGSNYLVNASVRFENTSGKSLVLPAQELVVGTATPMDSDDNSFPGYSSAMWYDGSSPQMCPVSYFNTNETTFFVFHRTVKKEYREGTSNVVWGVVQNQYFTLLAMPKQPAEQFVARPVMLPPLPGNPVGAMGVEAALVYPAQTLTAGSNLERRVVLYAGPKEYRTLAKVGDQFENRADYAMNFGTGFVTFWGVGTFFAKLLLSAMNGLHDMMPSVSYGWIIVLITIILRAVFWPLTAASMRSAKKMQALAPQVNALRDKYKDDPQKFTQKQWELWRKNKVSPMSGCLPMLVQMPVFIGFFTMIRSAIELRGAHFLWVTDLSKPDTLFMVPGLNFPLNLLPLLMVGTMVWQSHLQPVSPGMDPAQQKMMRFMPLIFLLFLYSYSSGMALYMTVSTLLGILQMQLMKKQAATAAPELTPAPKPKK